MTRRGLIIGNSHAAALRLAATAFAADWAGLTLDFAAMHGEVTGFAVRDGHLTGQMIEDRARLQQISGRDSFRLADYDFLAICGNTPSGFQPVQLWRQARCTALPSTQAAALHSGTDWALLSTPCFLAALTGLMQAARAFLLLADLAPLGLPTFLIPTPLLSATAIDRAPRFAAFSDLHHQGDGAALAALAEQALLAATGPRITAIHWPAEARQHGFFTHERFRHGARRLGTHDSLPQPSDDVLHANADYGRLVLTALYQRL